MSIAEAVGPILFARRCDRSLYHLSALMVLQPGAPPALYPMGGKNALPIELASICGRVIWRYDFVLPATDRAFYVLDGVRYAVTADLAEDARIAYVSCNGQATADDERDLDERNHMWRRLADEHERAPFSLMLHGGDQLYADEVVEAHPALKAWANSDEEEMSAHLFTSELEAAAEAYFFHRYADLYAQPGIAFLLARVPSLMMWDDHDIIDGWGSHDVAMLDSPVGQGLFQVARRMFLFFQMASSEQAPDPRLQNGGRTLSVASSFPGFDIIAPDLRSERRPDGILGPEGRLAVTRAFAGSSNGSRLFLMSSVPLLGPRLSFIESFIGIVPRLRRYEDDLRDQWQSRTHREEWRRFLLMLERTVAEKGGDVTVLSGEIHLATRGEMPFADGGCLRQLVASGIAHDPPPRLYARALGWLAWLGEDPLQGRPIRMRPLPGQRRIYAAERNYLVLERQGQQWTASWELEGSGRTPALDI
ncbi:MAG: alkaline phosphatase D family protein [Geminicoccaceae bacterium]